MSAWDYYTFGKERRCAYKHDRRFELRQICERSGQRIRLVWALFFNGRRVWEVHAMSAAIIVQSDAWDYIRNMRMEVSQ